MDSGNLLIVRPKSRVYDYIINKDWQGHPLGGLASWPKSLLHTIDCILANQNPTLALWGKDDLFQFYNDAYHELFGPGKPASFALGESAHLPQHCTWINIDEVAPLVFAENVHNQHSVRSRKDDGNFSSEHSFHFIFSPVWDTEGSVAGILACGKLSRSDTAPQPFKVAEYCNKHMAMAILSKKEMSLDFVSEKMMQYWGITQQQIGMNIINAVPELKTRDYYRPLANIFKERKPACAPHQLVQFYKNGEHVKKHVDFFFDPCLDDHGMVTDVIVSAADVSTGVAEKAKTHHSEREKFYFNQRIEDLVNQRTRELTTSNQKLQNANQKVSESMKELSRSNANLEGFAYTASHDLQEPLRKIQTFGALLKQKLTASGFDRDTVSLAERMQAAGQRMSLLITGLLDLSRLSVQHKMVPVNLNEAVQLAMDTLELKITETSAIIQVDNLNIVHGDLSQLTQLFQNLIGNSLRYVSPDRQPVISITCSPMLASDIAVELLPSRVADFYHQIVVSDNGIGFDQKHAEKIFVVFQRLHGRNSYDGTGIGLSICKQVVDNHHGIIYASGQEGVGATFTILLPIAGTN